MFKYVVEEIRITMKYLIIIILITPTLSQYMQTGLKPDVTFGDHNDRFDISNFLRQQKYQYKDAILDPQSDEYRRRERSKKKHKTFDIKEHRRKRNKEESSLFDLLETKEKESDRKKITKRIEDHINELANTIIMRMRSMRRFNDFAYHDDMNSGGGDVDDYNANLKKFEEEQKLTDGIVSARRLQDIVDGLHGSKATRRVMPDPEKEILLHYAFPLDVNIEGFLQVPLEDAL